MWLGVLGRGVVALGFRGFVFGGLVVVVVFLMRLLVGALGGGERRTDTYREKQGRRKKPLHDSNPNMTLTAGYKTPVTSVPREQPGGWSGAGMRSDRLGAGVRMAVVAMVMVMMASGSKRGTCNHHQKQSCCKQFLHTTNS